MMPIQVHIDSDQVIKALGRLSQEAPFVLSSAINNTLVDVQTGEIGHINDVFTVRRPRFVKQSVKISKFAKKTELEGIIEIADVGGKPTADILGKFETGKTKTSRKGGNVAIPTSSIRFSKSGVIPAGKRPTTLPNAFKLKTGSGRSFIVHPKGRGKKRELVFAYSLKPSVRIDRRLSFVNNGLRTISIVGQRNLDQAIDKALLTSRFR